MKATRAASSGAGQPMLGDQDRHARNGIRIASSLGE
jgi:hypothetical protein